MWRARRLLVVLKRRLASKVNRRARETKKNKGCAWEDLKSDVLISIFQRLDLKDLIVGAPLCCTSWYKASKDPSLWRNVDLRLSLNHGGKLIKLPQLIMFVIARSRGSLKSLQFPISASIEDLFYVADRFPAYKIITDRERVFKNIFSKLTQLESMDVDEQLIVNETTLRLINRSCPNFTKLKISDRLTEKTASLVCTALPKLKTIDLSNIRFLSRQVVLIILKGCEELQSLDLSGCGKIHGEDELLGIGLSRLKEFKWDDDHCSGREVDVIDRHYFGYINGTKEMLGNKYGAQDNGSEDYDLEFDQFDDDDEFDDP